MGKWAAATAILGVGGTGGAATLAAHSMGAFGGGSGGSKRVGNSSGSGSTSEEFQQGKQGRCFSAHLNNDKAIFKTWVSGKTIEATKDSLQEISQSNEVQWENDQASPVRGCLDYEWSTKDAGGKQWDGSSFRLVWVLAKGNRAFSVYLTAKGKSDKSFEFDGIAHTFRRDNENSGWQTEK